MNHAERRQVKKECVEALKSSKGFVLVVVTRQGELKWSGDTTLCDSMEDHRESALRHIAKNVNGEVHHTNVFHAKEQRKKAQSEKVAAIKARRSKELDEFREPKEGEPAGEAVVDEKTELTKEQFEKALA
jgi:hypothetical protein